MKVSRADSDGRLETSQIRCDRCGFESRLNLGLNAMFEIQEYVTVEFVAGYGATAFDDGDRYQTDLCQRCIKLLLGPYLRCLPYAHWTGSSDRRSDMNIQRERREALDAAERSGIREGLPPVSDFAREVCDRYVTGELTSDEAIAIIIRHYTVAADTGRRD